MQPKANLNNTQRAMLDKIYSQRLVARVMAYRNERGIEREKLIREYVAKQSTTEFKELLDAGTKYLELLKASRPKIEALGLSIENRMQDEPKLFYNTYRNDNEPAFIAEFDKETRATVTKIEELTDEVRLRIYGSDATYDAIDEEINELLKGIL